MTHYSNLVIRPLDDYIQKPARQEVKRRVSRVFVATTVEQSNSIVGYYTLSTLSIELSQLPLALARKLPRHPVPVALLGRLAVNQAAQDTNAYSLHSNPSYKII